MRHSNIVINLQKVVDICGHELPTNLQNFTQKNWSEHIPKRFMGATFFLAHPIVFFRGSQCWSKWRREANT